MVSSREILEKRGRRRRNRIKKRETKKKKKKRKTDIKEKDVGGELRGLKKADKKGCLRKGEKSFETRQGGHRGCGFHTF